ncbi:MAG TPA: hypothetical protein VJ302_22915, partial [Blastocatellia bacterium]|nr:hypothetical protein [Blastocatellia bacterium]
CRGHLDLLPSGLKLCSGRPPWTVSHRFIQPQIEIEDQVPTVQGGRPRSSRRYQEIFMPS